MAQSCGAEPSVLLSMSARVLEKSLGAELRCRAQRLAEHERQGLGKSFLHRSLSRVSERDVEQERGRFKRLGRQARTVWPRNLPG